MENLSLDRDNILFLTQAIAFADKEDYKPLSEEDDIYLCSKQREALPKMSIKAVLRTSCGLFSIDMEQKDVSCNIEGEDFSVVGDPKIFYYTFCCILKSVVDAMFEGESISIKISESERKVELSYGGFDIRKFTRKELQEKILPRKSLLLFFEASEEEILALLRRNRIIMEKEENACEGKITLRF